jgi:hypothetical protein
MASPYETYFADLLIKYTANPNGLETRHRSMKHDGDRCVVVVVADPASLPPNIQRSRLLFETTKKEQKRRGRSCFVDSMSPPSCKHAPPSQPTRKASYDNLLMLAIQEVNDDHDWSWNCDTTTTTSTRGVLIETSRFNIIDDVRIVESSRDTRRYPTGRRRSYSQVFVTGSGRRHLPTRTGGRQRSSCNNKNNDIRRRASFPPIEAGEEVAISRWDTNAAPSSSLLGRASRGLLNP